MLADIITWVALLVAALQALLMGMIGYPLARKRPGGMEAFHRSGFAWWLITLGLVLVAAVVVHPGWFRSMAPSTHAFSWVRVLTVATIGVVVLVVVELGLDRLTLGPARSQKATEERRRYEGSLPRWARGIGLIGLLAVVAVLEEAVFRAIALGGLWHGVGLAKPLAAGLSALAFGLSHWFYGWRQVAIKIIDGSILVWVALSAGWVTAAVVHVALNVILTLLSQRQARAHPESPVTAHA